MKKFSFLMIIGVLVSLMLFSCKKKEEEEEDDNTNTSSYSETEGNGSFSTANTIILSEEYDAAIDPKMDEDYFKIEASEDVTVVVNGSSTLDVRVHFFDHNQIDIFGGDAGSKGGTLNHTVQSSEYDGYFYFRVEDSYGNYTGAYTVKAN